MKSTWVDFKAVKEAVSLELILQRYGVLEKLRGKGDERRGRCPIHQGEGEDAFHANFKKNAFQCFSCKARGNVLDFVAAMEQCTVREAAIKLQEWFSVAATEGGTQSKLVTPLPARGGEIAAANVPLAFQLKGIDPNHSYLSDRGISRETADTFGVGFFQGKGSMRGRVVIPIHNERGELVAYAGRSIDGSEPKYKLPPGFHKSAVLFNLHRVTASEVIVVEGFFDCMKVWQSLHPFVVALMGCSLSEQQEHLLLRQFRTVSLLLDGDDAGRKAAEEIANRLVHSLHVRIVDLPDGKQPDQLEVEEIEQLFSRA